MLQRTAEKDSYRHPEEQASVGVHQDGIKALFQGQHIAQPGFCRVQMLGAEEHPAKEHNQQGVEVVHLFSRVIFQPFSKEKPFGY